MNAEPLRRSHMVRAAMLGIGVPLADIQRFILRLDSMEGPEFAWNRPLTVAEIAELVMILEDRDAGRCERFLKDLREDFAKRHGLTDEEMSCWTRRLKPEGIN